jgi:excisionase family DNA binding protein
MLATPKQAAEILGLSDGQIRDLLRHYRIPYVRVGSRKLIPRDAIQSFVNDNTVPSCRVETQAHAFAFSTNVNAGTSSGPSTAAAGSAQRALAIADRLNSHSPNSSTPTIAERARVIPLKA